MEKELENTNWIIMEMRKSLEKMREAQEEDSEWDNIAEAEEAWE